MTRRIRRIAPLQCGVVLASLLFTIALLYLPVVLLAPVLGGKPHGHGFLAVGLFLVLIAPVLYAMIGFIGGVMLAAIYNLLARWTGGLELTLAEAPEPPPFLR